MFIITFCLLILPVLTFAIWSEWPIFTFPLFRYLTAPVWFPLLLLHRLNKRTLYPAIAWLFRDPLRLIRLLVLLPFIYMMLDWVYVDAIAVDVNYCKEVKPYVYLDRVGGTIKPMKAEGFGYCRSKQGFVMKRHVFRSHTFFHASDRDAAYYFRQEKNLEALKDRYREVHDASAFDIRDHGIHDPKSLLTDIEKVVQRE